MSSKKNTSKKSKKQVAKTPRRPRRKRRAQGKSILSKFGGRNSNAPMPMMVQQAPVSAAMVVSTSMSSTRFKVGRVEGQRLSGRFAFAKVGNFTEMGESQNCLDPFGAPTITNVFIELNPQTIFAAGSREYFESLPFAQFKFTKFRLIYVSQVPTTATTNVAFAYYADSGEVEDVDPDTSAYDQLIVSPNSLAFPSWTTGVVLDVSDQLSQNWFYTEVVTANPERLTNQGFVYAQLSTMADTKAGDQLGILYADYTLELIEPRFVTGAAGALSAASKAKSLKLHAESKIRRKQRDRRLPETKGDVAQSAGPEPDVSAPSDMGARLETDVLSPGGVYAISGPKSSVARPEGDGDEVIVDPPRRQPTIVVGKDRKSASKK